MWANPRRWIVVLLATSIVGFTSSKHSRASAAEVPPDAAVGQQHAQTPKPSLRDLLEKDLQARLPEDFAFIDRVISLVNQGKLSEKLVRSTYYWARRKPRRRFQYFRRAMTYRAARLGIDLD